MEITAQLVKELRERSGAGMMECKKALTENGGDIDAAMEYLRKPGLAKADKKAGRVAAEGRIVLAQDGGKAVLVEINSETDFVAKDENFIAFADDVAKTALASGAPDVEALQGRRGRRGDTRRGRRARRWSPRSARTCRCAAWCASTARNTVAAYVHGGRIGVLVELKGGDAELARGLAMHVAAMNPPYISAGARAGRHRRQGKGNRAGADVREGQGQAGRDPREDHPRQGQQDRQRNDA